MDFEFSSGPEAEIKIQEDRKNKFDKLSLGQLVVYKSKEYIVEEKNQNDFTVTIMMKVEAGMDMSTTVSIDNIVF